MREDPGSHVVLVTVGATESVERVRLARGAERVLTAPERSEARALETGQPREEAGWRPGWLTWTGVGLAAVGVAGSIGFGVRALDLHDQFDESPTFALADEGSAMRDLTNVSIGVAVLGAVLFALDLFVETGGD